MKDISIIIPVHEYNDVVGVYFCKAVTSVIMNNANYEGSLKLCVVGNKEVNDKLSNFIKNSNLEIETNFITNNGSLDFCSQINLAAKEIDTEYFSILEFDDEYTPKWFKMASEYIETYQDISVFLPVVMQYDKDMKNWQFGNEMVLATSFSNEIGYIDFECLEICSTFNLTGGIFNTMDFLEIGGFKPSIKVAFSHEFLLRLTSKGLKAYVVPKEGYKHMVGRENSLNDIYNKTLSDEEIQKWFDLAKREHVYDEDRNKTIVTDVEENLK